MHEARVAGAAAACLGADRLADLRDDSVRLNRQAHAAYGGQADSMGGVGAGCGSQQDTPLSTLPGIEAKPQISCS